MIDTEFLDQLGRFNLIVSKRVTSVYTGPRLSISSGGGIVFKDYRPYALGDDFRAIDWKVYARTDDLHIKTYEEERAMNVHILVDNSASMDFGKRISKFDFASMIGVGYAYLSLKENEKFQFATFGDTMEIFSPRRGMNQLAAMVEHLNSKKPEGLSKFQDAMVQYKKIINSRSAIIIVSDFLISTEEIIETLPLFAKHDVKVVQVLDPVEKQLSMEGEFDLKDSETKDKMRTYISPKMRQNYHCLMAKHAGKIEDACNKLGMHFYQFTSDMPVFDAFYQMLK